MSGVTEAVPVIIASAGAAGLSALVVGWFNRGKVSAEQSKVKAEAAQIFTDIAAKSAQTSEKLYAQSEEANERLRADLRDTKEELRDARRQLEQANGEMRAMTEKLVTAVRLLTELNPKLDAQQAEVLAAITKDQRLQTRHLRTDL